MKRTFGALAYSDDAFTAGASDPGIPGWFVAFFVLGLVGAVATGIYKVTMARDMARKAGMDEAHATAMTLLDEDGLSATYLASNLKQGQAAPATTNQPRSADDRLAELKSLLDRGFVTQAEYDARRQAIIESI